MMMLMMMMMMMVVMVMVKHSDLITAFAIVLKCQHEKLSVAFRAFQCLLVLRRALNGQQCFPNRMKSVNHR